MRLEQKLDLFYRGILIGIEVVAFGKKRHTHRSNQCAYYGDLKLLIGLAPRKAFKYEITSDRTLFGMVNIRINRYLLRERYLQPNITMRSFLRFLGRALQFNY